MNDPAFSWVELERLPTRRACQEFALVLQAVNIRHGIMRDGAAFVLVVAAPEYERARTEIDGYRSENENWPPKEDDFQPFAAAPLSAAFYFVVLLSMFLAQQNHAYGINWTRVGRSFSERVRAGEWWRVFTALTLHGDLAHMAGNVVFGSFFAVLLGQVVGVGVAWTTIFLAGGVGNLLNAYIHGPEHASIGASTAVFGAVGALAAHRWMNRGTRRRQSRKKWLPLFMGLALLGFLGFPQEMPGANEEPTGPLTDVMAHVTGFGVGAVLGAIHPVWQSRVHLSGAAQLALAWSVPVVLVLTWALAIA